jgi:DNA-binding transcriptional LysR family regulator
MNDNWVELWHFRYILEILEQEGIRPAADRLNTSAPNLCTQANDFQDHFKVRLYEIGAGNSFILMEAGTALRAMTPGIFELIGHVIDAMIAIHNGEIRALRMGSDPIVDQELFRVACEIHKTFLPRCKIQPAHSDTNELVREVLSGEIDAALVTLPASDPELCVEELRRDRLVACLRADDPLAEKPALRPTDLQQHLRILHHPQRYPEAHARLLELLREVGVRIDEYSRADHPAEMQHLVKNRYGLTLLREGTALDPELTTRPIHRSADACAILIEHLRRALRGKVVSRVEVSVLEILPRLPMKLVCSGPCSHIDHGSVAAFRPCN